jgi:hypothetical protein
VPSWATETRRWNAWLHAQCDQGDSAARHWVQQQGPWTQPLISRGLKKALWHFQQGQCYWCRRPMPLREATIEHVIASGSPVWATMQPLEQLLSLRVSHRRCNTAYHHWRRQHRRAARAADWRRMWTIRRMVRQDPFWPCWIGDTAMPVGRIRWRRWPSLCARPHALSNTSHRQPGPSAWRPHASPFPESQGLTGPEIVGS